MTVKNRLAGAHVPQFHLPLASLALFLALACGLTLSAEVYADAEEALAFEPVEFASDDASGPHRISEIIGCAEEETASAATEAINAKSRISERAAKVEAFVSEALSYEGTAYVYGGMSPRGFDCSGFVLYSLRESLGIEVPRTAAAQSALGENVPMDALERGDLLYWGGSSGVYHTGIYLGEGTYIHAAGRGKGVRVQTFEYNAPTFAKRLL